MRKTSDLQNIRQRSGQSRQLSDLLQRAERLQALNQRLQKRVPATVRGQFSLANVRDQVAVLLCPSPMEASKIRMHSREILQIIQQEFKTSIKKIQVKVDAQPFQRP